MSEKVFAIDDETEAYRLIAHFSTYYGDSKQNRKDNIALAARKIDGLVLYPEDEFSFNDLVGRRTVENGFKTAYVIQNGDFVEGVGGGVCQVSSTLYNCALLANLAITCVRAHSLPVSYVAPSFRRYGVCGKRFAIRQHSVRADNDTHERKRKIFACGNLRSGQIRD